MLDRDLIIADADRRDRARRHIRAEAERDLARRRRLIERIRSADDPRTRVLASLTLAETARATL